MNKFGLGSVENSSQATCYKCNGVFAYAGDMHVSLCKCTFKLNESEYEFVSTQDEAIREFEYNGKTYIRHNPNNLSDFNSNQNQVIGIIEIEYRVVDIATEIREAMDTQDSGPAQSDPYSETTWEIVEAETSARDSIEEMLMEAFAMDDDQ